MADASEQMLKACRSSIARLEERGLLLPVSLDGPTPPPVGLVEGDAKNCGFVPPRTLQEIGDGGACWQWIEAQPAFLNIQSLPRMLAIAGIDEGRSVADARLAQLCVPHRFCTSRQE